MRSHPGTIAKMLLAALAIAIAAFYSAPALALSMAEELEGNAYLPIGLTPEEESRRAEIGAEHTSSPPPTAPVRNPGEFEPMTGVIVRYPFGLPTDLMAELAEDVTLWVIVEDAADEASAASSLSSAGCNMSNVEYIYGATNSIWTRDYGPWFVVDGEGGQGIVDHVYNRPRPLDDVIPATIGADWGIPVYGMDLEATGGNYMSDGRGVAMSTRLTLDENTELTTAEINSIANAYLGIETFHWMPYIQTGGIHHIDCWAKLLSPEKLLVKQVDPSHSDYDRIESNVAYFESITNSYGRPYEIIRVYAPNDEPYTNSLIVNDKVFVPMWNNSNDAGALATYTAAMPGYEILGYTGSWLTDDAIHCRTMGVTDRYMLRIDHVPLGDKAFGTSGYTIEAEISDASGAGLKPDSLIVYWKADAAPQFTATAMTASRSGVYDADIPTQPDGTTVSYYIFAADNSGRRERSPYVGAADPHTFDVITDSEAPVVTHSPLADVRASEWPPTVSAFVTDNCDIADVTLEWWLNGAPQTYLPMSRTTESAPYEATFTGTVSPGDVVSYLVRAADAASPANETTHPASGTHGFAIVDAMTCVVWEPTSSPATGAAIAAALDALGVSYDYTTDEPDYSEYAVAFVCLGVYSSNHSLSAPEANAIVAFLDSGGNVYMEGGDCWSYDFNRAIYNDHFGVSGLQDGSGDLSAPNGRSGTFTEGMSFSYSGANSYLDDIAPTGTGFSIFENPADGFDCGVANDAEGYRTVACSFELGGLDDGTEPSTKETLVEEILEFFGVVATGVKEPPLAPIMRLAQNSPNPFNPTTTVAFELPSAGRAELSVYDASGRRVAVLASGRHAAGRHVAVWNGRDERGREVASGVYFFRLSRGSDAETRKGVLLK